MKKVFQESVSHGPHSDGAAAAEAGHRRAGGLGVLLGVSPGVLQEMGVNRDPVTQEFPFSAQERLWTQTWIAVPFTGCVSSVR